MSDASDKPKTKDVIGAWFVLVLVGPLILCLFDGLSSFVHDLLGWLRVGEWPSDTTWDGLHQWILADRPYSDWVIPDRLLIWFLDTPRVFGMPAIGIAIFGIELLVVVYLMKLGEALQQKRQSRS